MPIYTNRFVGAEWAVQQPHSNRTESTVGAVAEPAAAARAAVAEPLGLLLLSLLLLLLSLLLLGLLLLSLLLLGLLLLSLLLLGLLLLSLLLLGLLLLSLLLLGLLLLSLLLSLGVWCWPWLLYLAFIPISPELGLLQLYLVATASMYISIATYLQVM